MKILTQFIQLGLFLALLVKSATIAQAQLTQPILPKTQPNVVLKIQRQSGTCPRAIGIWTSFRNYEGGGEHTVIADTLTIAGKAELILSSKKLVEYRAPLKKAYAECNGKAIEESDGEDLYLLLLREGNVYFRAILPPDTDANPSSFSNVGILNDRPYVRWAIAD